MFCGIRGQLLPPDDSRARPIVRHAARSASPLHQVEGNRVPFLLAYGERDLPAIIENNEHMSEALRAQGAQVHRLVLSGFDHFDTALEIRHPDNPWMECVRAWMRDTHGAARRSSR